MVLLIFWFTFAYSDSWNYNWDGLNHLKYSDNFTFVHNIFLIRHGQANESLDNKPLTALGEKQAHLTGKRLKQLNIKFDKIFTSGLSRAIETGAIIHQYLCNETFPSEDLLLNEGEGAISSPNAFNITKVFFKFIFDFFSLLIQITL